MNTITAATHLGIWMDHASAHLMEFNSDSMTTETIHSKFTHQEKADGLSKSEFMMHTKEQHQEADYYKKLGEVIKGYKEVILFGPTNAKLELLNLLKSDPHFEGIKIETEQTDKMTENQEHAFVRTYYSKEHLNF